MPTLTNARLDDGSIANLRIVNGRWAAVEEPVTDTATLDLAGRLLLPSWVEGHIHLDTSFYGDKWQPHTPCTQGFDVRERVKFQAENFARAAPMRERAEKQLRLCLAQGSTVIRSHVTVDGTAGLANVETLLELRESWKDLVDIQLVAFPQSGIISSPRTEGYLNEAVRMGCDLVGGLDPASFDRRMDDHLDIVFGIAERHGCGIDIHLHDGGSLGQFELEVIAARTVDRGLQGAVAVSHAYCLGDLDAESFARTADTLARAGVAIMTNAPGSYSFPPVEPLLSHGVNVFFGSDNIRDSWWPYGDGDMLRRINMVGYRAGLFEDRQLRMIFDQMTRGGRRALGHPQPFSIGASADFVVLDAEHIPEAVIAAPPRRDVYRRGQLIARNGDLLKMPSAL